MSPKHKVSEKSLANLLDKSAPDRPGHTVSGGVRLTPDDWQWLEKMPEGKSFHLRQALKMYRQHLDGSNVGATAE